MLKKLLIIGHTWIEPNSSAAGKRMLQLIRFFQAEDYEITFVTSYGKSDFAYDLNLLNIKSHQIELNDSSFDEFVKNLNPQAVLFDRFLTEEQFGWRVAANCPNALRILDTEDLHCLRKAREQAIKKGEDFSIEFMKSLDVAKRELASIYRVDLTLMISKFEFQLLIDGFQIKEESLHYLPFLLENFDLKCKTFEERQDFMTIGNFLHPPNWDAVLQLKNEIWKGIHHQLPKAKLHIYGAYPSQKVMQLHNEKEGFIVHGRAENAQEVIENAKVMLAPLRFGAGLKGKLLEAKQFGTPSMTTSIGAEAMCDCEEDWNGFVENEKADFIEKAVYLYSNKLEWQKAQKKGFTLLKNQFQAVDFLSDFKLHLEDLQTNLGVQRSSNFIGQMLQHHTIQSTKYLSKWIEEKNK